MKSASAANRLCAEIGLEGFGVANVVVLVVVDGSDFVEAGEDLAEGCFLEMLFNDLFEFLNVGLKLLYG